MYYLKLRVKDGFTLIELMIVIAIIGILASIAIPQFSAYRNRSFNATAMADLRHVATAQEAYHLDYKVYAASEADLSGAYGISASANVSVATSGGSSSYVITAYHNSGDKTYTMNGPGGTIDDL